MAKVMILRSGMVGIFEVDEIVGEEVGLKYLQEKVGGYIEIPYLSKDLNERGIDIVINEEGKLIGLEPTIVVMNSEDSMVDVVVGTVVFCGHDDEGRSIGLNDIQMKYLEKVFNSNVWVENSKGSWEVKALSI